MTSVSRVVFPDRLAHVLDYRSKLTPSDCPADVTLAMSKLPFFSAASVSVPPPPSRFAGRLRDSEGAAAVGGAGAGISTSNRFAHLSSGGGGGGWRPTQGGGGGGGAAEEDGGFQTYNRRRGDGRHGHRTGVGSGGGGKTGSWGGGGNGKYYGGRAAAASAAPTATAPAPAATVAAVSTVTEAATTTASVAAPAVGGAGVGAEAAAPPLAFSSAAIKANVATEDRILAKVKGKINKIGPSTYDSTKTFMQQILDSDETDFLDDFMKFVFQKAATESAFCPIYARLLHELSDEFTHLRDVMRTLFRDYTSIFSEVDPVAPDPSCESYKEFVEGQERKKFRRGYSQFVAELVKHGEVDLEGFRTLLFQIVDVIVGFHNDSGKKQLAEEYIDCLSNMCKSASSILIANTWSADIVTRLTELVTKPAASLPGFSPKARFALMNLKDYAARGWK